MIVVVEDLTNEGATYTGQDSSELVEVTVVGVGPQGPPGADGEPGPQGPQGPPGESGGGASGPDVEILRNGNLYAGTLASSLRLRPERIGDPVLTAGGESWYDELREIGNVIEDQAVEDGGTGQWIWTFTGRGGPDGTKAGAMLSDDQGETWGAPFYLNGAGAESEDPYIAKDLATNLIYRDNLDRAYMYCEKKSGATHDGIDVYRSDPGSLTVWTRVGLVLTGGPTDSWYETDVSSPVVGVDVENGDWHLFFEGRRDPGLSLPSSQEGMIGHAVSSDGLTFTVDDDPIITGTDGAWDSLSIVPDDIARIGTVWVLTDHAQNDDGFYSFGAHVSVDDPVDWTAGSFVDHVSNPIVENIDVGEMAEVMFWPNDDNYAVTIHPDGLFKVRIGLDEPPFVSEGRVETIEANIDDVESDVAALQGQTASLSTSITTVAATAGAALDAAEDANSAAIGAQNTADEALEEAAKSSVLEGALTWHTYTTEAETAPGSDLSGLGQPDSLDGSSDLTPPNINVVTGTWTAPGAQGVLWQSPTPDPGMQLLGVSLSNVVATIASGNAAFVLMDGTFTLAVGSTELDGVTYRGGQAANSVSVSGDYGNVILVLAEPSTSDHYFAITFPGDVGSGQNTVTADDLQWIFVPEEATSGGAVSSVNGGTGDVVIDKAGVGLGNVDNTSDVDKPVSTATQSALDAKQAKTPIVALSGSGSEALTLDAWHTLTTSGTKTLTLPTIPADGYIHYIDIEVSNGGSHTINLPTIVWDGGSVVAFSGRSVLTLVCRNGVTPIAAMTTLAAA